MIQRYIFILVIFMSMLLPKFSLAHAAQDQLETYAQIVYQTYLDSYRTAVDLQAAIDAFLADPNQVTLNTAKDAWLVAREPYGQTEAFRFYEGPIDFVDDEAGIEGPEGRLNAWPLDEAYIDYVRGNFQSGIINDMKVTINRSLLIDANQADDESEVSTGYHAIEFLLWGQDFNPDGPGERPVSDYDGATTFTKRRAIYLKEVTALLVDDLKGLVEAWDPNSSTNYAAQFIQQDPDVALSKIMTGLATLAGFELASERMAVPLDSGDQEDEHSCFSDNTHNDFIYNAQSIQNVYLGQYGDIKGVGLDELVAAVDSSLNAKIKINMAMTIAKLQALPSPIDQRVLASEPKSAVRMMMEEAIVLLQEQANLMQEAGKKLGLDVEIVE